MKSIEKELVINTVNGIQSLISRADNAFMHYCESGKEVQFEYKLEAEYYLKNAFIHMLVFLEVHDLPKTYEKINDLFKIAQKGDLLKSEMGIDEPSLVWGSALYSYLDAIAASYNARESINLITKDIVSILRASLYSITDPKVFPLPPSNEKEVHVRIESVLRCIFPDLKHKPHLTKPIKNFEPDTGLPSVRTLIEYKFISNEKEAKSVADEVLADTRGYISKDWDSFLYVIYETRRVMPEYKWDQHLKECEAGKNTKVIVLSGEPTKEKKLLYKEVR